MKDNKMNQAEKESLIITKEDPYWDKKYIYYTFEITLGKRLWPKSLMIDTVECGKTTEWRVEFKSYRGVRVFVVHTRVPRHSKSRQAMDAYVNRNGHTESVTIKRAGEDTKYAYYDLYITFCKRPWPELITLNTLKDKEHDIDSPIVALWHYAHGYRVLTIEMKIPRVLEYAKVRQFLDNYAIDRTPSPDDDDGDDELYQILDKKLENTFKMERKFDLLKQIRLERELRQLKMGKK
jgi:hypothetical protein